MISRPGTTPDSDAFRASPDGSLSPWGSTPKLAAVGFVLALGALRVWIGRYSISPDGMSYLDLGDATFHRRWFDSINGLWSPLYAWLLGAIMFVVRPSRGWEFPVAHVVNFLIFVVAFLCFELLLRALARDLREDTAASGASGFSSALSERALFALGYAVFLWTSLDVITVWALAPDLLVAAFVYLTAALMLHLRRRGSLGLAVALGVTLGFGYLAKSVMFPLGFVVLFLTALIAPQGRRGKFLLPAAFCFLAVCAPWVAALSHVKDRFTFGDAGLVNYSSGVSPGGRVINWQGDPPASGVPVHPTRKLFSHPDIFEFANPVGGTYPPSYDPSYWNEGRRWTWDVRAQVRTLLMHGVMYAGLLLRAQPGLLAAALALFLAGGIASVRALLRNWFLLAWCVAALGLYMLVHVEVRYVGAFVAVLWMVILFELRIPELGRSVSRNKLAEYLALAVVVTILLSLADGTVRAIREGGPFSARGDIAVADDLEALGLRPGEQIAVIGDGNWFYWARLGRYKIVSTIMASDSTDYWNLAVEQRQGLNRVFTTTGARALITPTPPFFSKGDGWERVGATEYYLHWLPGQVDHASAGP